MHMEGPMPFNSIVRKPLVAACFAAAAAFSSSPLLAKGQTASDPIPLSQLNLPQSVKDALLNQLKAPKGAPGIAFGSPVAFGAAWGDLYAGLGGNTLPDNSADDVDGSLALGFGLGDANKFVGLDTTIGIISLNEGFGEDGNVSLKLHTLLPNSSAFAIGLENTGRWGSAQTTSSSVYAVYSKLWSLNAGSRKMPFSTSIGVGSERFVDPGSDGNTDGVGVFGSVALQLHQQFSTILDWTGRDLNAGVSVVPFRTVPVTVTLGAINLTENNNAEVEFSAGIGYSYNFKRR